ncbi:MAG TPA: TetR/AcrR family transcriptional regulator [Cyclobacteriaceae bacterium]|nr:TetR/AcrR family transcriptional regulator [Cyclobacteriaceae bacterium]
MAKRKQSKSDSLSTEEKIKVAARKVFLRKGFSATRTRDIAEEAGLNLALLNYYFRSKQKLFEEVMKEKIQTLLQTLIPVLNNPSTSLEEKIDLIVSNYIEVLLANSDLPIFVLNELRKENISFISGIPVQKIFLQSSFVMQLKERRSDINPVHFLVSLLGMTIFPFVAKPILTQTGIVNEKSFQTLMKEREALIPLWMNALLKTKL